MKMVKTTAILGAIAILMSCASQQKPAPQEDARIGQLQSQVADLQKQVADKDAELGALKKSDAEKQAALEMAAQKDEKDVNDRLADLKRIFAKEIARGDLDIRRFRDVLIVSVKDSVFAANVVQYLQEKGGVDPLQLVATSLGQYRPRADNSTEEGQQKNRRVDFVLVARTLYEINQLKAQ
jgi:hypothetical protein